MENKEQIINSKINMRFAEGAKKNLLKAKQNKNDEFFTKMESINQELAHYHDQLQNKIIYLNCDDTTSNF